MKNNLLCIHPARPTRALPHRQARERGIVLIAALAVLLMLTLLSIGMFRSFGLEERITGNSREKQHAFYAAQSALQYAETWLSANSTGSGVACSGASSAPTICAAPSNQNQQQFTYATTNWSASGSSPYGTTYQPAEIVTSGSSTVTAQTVYALPQFAINYLGQDPSTAGASLYQVTALGFGGNANAAAVVQSVYSVKSGTTCVSKPC
jgi:type IV pilus assembly protein PilX